MITEQALICAFLGCEVYESYKNEQSGYTMYSVKGSPVIEWRKNGLKTGGFYDTMMLQMCQFDTSWDWLMMAVERIESIYDDHHGYFGVFISSNGCTIQGTHLNRAIDDLDGYGYVYFDYVVCHTKLESTYEAVVRFIEWYNNNKSKLSNDGGSNTRSTGRPRK